MLLNKQAETSKILVENLINITGLKEIDIKILIDCISNEIFKLVIIENKHVKFGPLGIFVPSYERNGKKQKRLRKCTNKKTITLKNSVVATAASKEILKVEKEKYENRIIW